MTKNVGTTEALARPACRRAVSNGNPSCRCQNETRIEMDSGKSSKSKYEK